MAAPRLHVLIGVIVLPLVVESGLLGQVIPTLPNGPSSYSPGFGYRSDPTTGRKVPPSIFAENYPPDLQRLKEQAKDAHFSVEVAREAASQRIQSNPDVQALQAKLDEARSRLTQATDPDDRNQAAMDKMHVSAELTALTAGSIVNDPGVVAAQKRAEAADLAVSVWIQNHRYSSVSEIVQMVPALGWLATLDGRDRYLWTDQLIDRVNDELASSVNGRGATMTILGERVVDETAVAAIYNLPPSNAICGKMVDVGGIRVRIVALAPESRLGALKIAGKLLVRAHYSKSDGPPVDLDVALTDCTAVTSLGPAPDAEAAMPTPENPPSLEHSSWVGSGFFISTSGLILTNRHVATDEDNPSLTPKLKVICNNHRVYDASLVATSDNMDLAVLRIQPNGDVSCVGLNDDDLPSPGMHVDVLGFPFGSDAALGTDLKITQGIVTGVNTANSGDNTWAVDGCDVLLDARINPGNSGGPIIDRHGRVTGIIAAKTLHGQVIEDSYGIGIGVGHIRKFLKINGIQLPDAVPSPDQLDDEGVFKNSAAAIVRIEASD